MPRRRRKRDPDPKKAIGYIRVSTDEQMLGLGCQSDAIEAWCFSHDAELVAV